MERKKIYLLIILFLVLSLTWQSYRANVLSKAYLSVSEDYYDVSIIAKKALYLADSCNNDYDLEEGWEERIEKEHNDFFDLT